MTGYHKTLDEHRAMLHGMVRLQLHVLHRWSVAHPQEPFADALSKRVDIWHKTDLNPGGLVAPFTDPDGVWAGLVERLGGLRANCADAAGFEEQAHALLAARIDARAPLDLQLEMAGEHLRDYTYGSLRFHDCAPAEPGTVFLHIANAIAPRSIFADPAYLPGCLRRLLERAEAIGASRVRTETWLNAHPAWLALFPACWRERLGPPLHEVQWHYGYWGQFLNASGRLNTRLAEAFRASGVLPYAPRTSWATIAELRGHLAGLP